MNQALAQALALLDSGGPLAWALAGLGGVLWSLLCIRGLRLLGAPARPGVLGLPACRGVVALAMRAAWDEAKTSGALELTLARWRGWTLEAVARYRRPVRTLTHVAPLLGLLGTVVGMVDTFGALGHVSLSQEPEALTRGISQALITTELGLVSAVAGLFVGRALDQVQARRTRQWNDFERWARAALERGVA